MERVFLGIDRLDCALCGKRMATIREEVTHEKTDGVPICRSCFEVLLKKADFYRRQSRPGKRHPSRHGRA
jgi:hypothetical protein